MPDANEILLYPVLSSPLVGEEKGEGDVMEGYLSLLPRLRPEWRSTVYLRMTVDEILLDF